MATRASRAAVARKHLQRAISGLLGDGFPQKPPRGWIRAIRDALGMTTRQLAARLRVSQPTLVALEKGEVLETISLKTLRRAAAALDCSLVYALVPNQPLEDMVRARAQALAEAQRAHTDQTMRLENQSLREPERTAELHRLTEEYLRIGGSRLWDRA